MMKHPTLPGSFYKVGAIYYYDAPTKFGRVRKSTRCKTIDDAIAWVSNTPNVETRAHRPIDFSQTFAGRIVHQAKWNAKARKIPFELTTNDLIDMWDRSRGYCEVSGLAFDLRKIEGVKRRPFIPSIDRRNLNEGYTMQNCRLVCAAVNLAMNQWGEDILWQIASSMVSRRMLRHNLAIRGQLSATSKVLKTIDNGRLAQR